MWEICRIGAQVRPEIVLCIRFVKKAPSAAIDDRPSSNRKEEVIVIAIEKKDSSVYLCSDGVQPSDPIQRLTTSQRPRLSPVSDRDVNRNRDLHHATLQGNSRNKLPSRYRTPPVRQYVTSNSTRSRVPRLPRPLNHLRDPPREIHLFADSRPRSLLVNRKP
ncbi:hypothetical protein ALC56_11742 [Trachymyrmex septentrionalis]|uniref:Uncharacterized protein n=1 Tax=Trachymyrmex septentrionalis TaxID=34720 RepID=A0A195F0C4_9HYME|nr:hypothetical protein ALC56_11742 [Trachymyrmex septentrionalis]